VCGSWSHWRARGSKCERAVPPAATFELRRSRAVFVRQAPRAVSLGRAGGVAIFVTGSVFWIWQAAESWATDALTYRAGAAAFIAGADPWSVSHAGWSFAALPPTVILFLPAALMPEAVFVVAWQTLTIASAVAIVRRLRLQWWWILYPPLTFGVMVGSPAVAGLAALLMGLPLVGLILRPHLIFAADWRSISVFGVLLVLTLAVMPAYLASFPDVIARYAIESGQPVNLWASPGMVLAGLTLALLATVDRRAAAWLVGPAIGPSMGWYGFTMVMPVASLPLAVATSLPIHGLGAWAIASYALVRFLRARAERDSEGSRPH
jgi:hypothetical protein